MQPRRDTFKTSYLTKTTPDRHGQQLTSLQKKKKKKKKSNPKHQVTNNISAEQRNDHFSTIAEKIVTSNPKNNSLDKLQEFCLSKNNQSKFDIPLMTMTEVYNALKYLKESGTRDPDGLDTKTLPLAAALITSTLTYVFNLCILKSTFHTAFKTAKVIHLYKSGDSANPSNHRPISIVSVLSKPLEKPINKHLLMHLDKYNLLHSNQSGFRKQHSCQTALTSLVDQWLTNIINNDEFNGVVFID